MMPNDPDRTLIETLRRAGPAEREDAFAQLYERHGERTHALCLRRTRNGEDALDALQETFLTACLQIGHFRGEARFSTWLHRIAINKCGEIYRRRNRRRRHESQAEAEWARHGSRPTGWHRSAPVPEVDEGSRPHLRAEADEREQRVRRAVGALPRLQRAAVELRYFESLAYDEIAAILRVPVGTVKSRLFRAHRALARDLPSQLLTA